ncbi:unnamed protein product [Acanthoscelides obtectus]|uniref:Uncharacterized protein n=1 Tax=Acanthoscelides obtectus TaxID=200917 RepID=A0A9P0KN97_ACAOB|nr:unnamed protein product [Acanthoscelides obtectus]CAK1671639.1 hypothetical protein AOBTE_LOCUS28379 [Acanthoscelides obtectus]
MPVRTILVLNQRYCQVELFDHHKKKHISVLKYENSRTIRRAICLSLWTKIHTKPLK